MVMMMMEKYLPLGCVILASGHSARFGSNKLLQDFRGRPLLEYILRSTEEIFAQRVVVTRYEKIGALCAARGIPYLLHKQPFLNDTVRLGVDFLRARAAEKLHGYLFCTGDQPFLKRESIIALAENFLQEENFIHRLAYLNSAGNPMLFPRALEKELRSLPEDRGGNFLAKKYPERVRLVQVQDKYELFDIDSVRDLRFCLNLAAARYSE